MRYTLDKTNHGHAMVWDSPLDMVKDTIRDCRKHNWLNYVNVNYPGRKATTWEQVEKFLQTPWPEGCRAVLQIAEGIKAAKISKPTSVKRKKTWSEDDGELDVDRLLNQEDMPYRLSKRKRVHAPMSVTLLNNVDVPSNCNATGVFFRSAVCIAVADFLEEAGYGVEVWQWCLGENVYPGVYHKQFSACRPKQIGSPVDYHALCDTMSAWFCSDIVFGSFACSEAKPARLGMARLADPYHTDWRLQPVAPWAGHLDITHGTQVIQIPRLTGVGTTDEERIQDGIRKGVEIAKKALAAVEKASVTK